VIFSENRYPPRIKGGAGFFRIMLQVACWRNCLALQGGWQAPFDPNRLNTKAARIAARRLAELREE